MSSHSPPSSRQEFRIAIICALPLEFDAVSLLIDQYWDEDEEVYGRAQGDLNTYITGRIGKHNVVLAVLPNMGKASAAGAAASMRMSYSGLEIALLVGICGGVPGAGTNEALLGDVIVSKRMIQYDLEQQFGVDNDPGRPNKLVRSLIASFETTLGRTRLRQRTGQYLKDLQNNAKRERYRHSYWYPGVAEDKLFAATYRHRHQRSQGCSLCDGETDSFCEAAAGESCTEIHCDETQLVRRERLDMRRNMEPDDAQCPELFIGGVASGDSVIKSGEHRDRVAKEENIIAFEMEGAGVWDEIPCIIIKGICDYADSHKNKLWQPFAAATAASVMKAVLDRYVMTDNPLSDAQNAGSAQQNVSGNEVISDHTYEVYTQIEQGDEHTGTPLNLLALMKSGVLRDETEHRQ